MNREIDNSWNEMASNFDAFLIALGRFFKADSESRIQLIRTGYQKNPRLVVELLRYMPESDLKILMPFLLEHARSVHGYLDHFRRAILSLPKDWLLEHIESSAESILQNGDDDEYRRLLELYFRIDPQLTRRLAERAVRSPDANIREAGQDFIEKLKS